MKRTRYWYTTFSHLHFWTNGKFELWKQDEKHDSAHLFLFTGRLRISRFLSPPVELFRLNQFLNENHMSVGSAGSRNLSTVPDKWDMRRLTSGAFCQLVTTNSVFLLWASTVILRKHFLSNRLVAIGYSVLRKPTIAWKSSEVISSACILLVNVRHVLPGDTVHDIRGYWIFRGPYLSYCVQQLLIE